MGQPKGNTHFHISLFPGWEDQSVYTFKGPDDSGVQHNLLLVIDRDISGIDLAEYAEQKMEGLKEGLQGMEILKQQEKQLKSGIAAYEVVFKWGPTPETILFQKQVYLIVDNKGYTFTATFSKKTLQTIGNEVDAMINSFKPVPGS
jgi:hypothetical protein